MKLQDIKDKFEERTLKGNEVEFLAYKEGQTYSVIGMVLSARKWLPCAWSSEGVSEHSIASFTLMCKKKHLPKDLLCEVWNEGDNHKLRYSDGVGGFFDRGADSKTRNHARTWANYKVLKQDPVPWFNDAPCPIPEGLKYQVWFDGRWHHYAGVEYEWETSTKEPTTAYQILGSIE